ncbi:MAG: 4Fe-4S binding protein [Bacteroidales bacterium]|nr:4Fe-4S binding protein [Bacteroidales bacterium]
MCEFCTQHGEGRTWYLNAKNYAAELSAELDRKNFISHFYRDVIEKGNRQVTFLEKPIMKRIGIPAAVKKQLISDNKKVHFGQVVPIEDVEKIIDMATSVTRVACGCRWAKEKKESRLCYGLTMGMPEWHSYLDMDYFGSPEVSHQEYLSKEEAIKSIRETDKKGYVHSVWTFGTPFIGALCNCESEYCLAMRTTVGLNMPAMFRAEYVARTVYDNCNGCKACVEKCQFGAIDFDDSANNLCHAVYN